jgi:Ca-activated chloride channel family protein
MKLHLPGFSGEHNPAMSFLSPEYLWLLLVVPCAVLAYMLLLRRRKKDAVRYGNFGMLKQALGTSGRIRRHVPPALFLLALTLMILGIARPSAVLSLTSHKSTVIMVLDVSGSMKATDIKPTRIEAMQQAAKSFITQQPKDVNIGIVAFAGSAFLIQPPTTDHVSLNSAIDGLKVQRRTAVGSAILTALAALFPEEDFNLGPNPGGDADAGRSLGEPLNAGRPLGEQAKAKPVLVAPGSDQSAVVILLTDGATNAGADPIEAARQAANHGVRVFTVGFGTTEGAIVEFGGWGMRAQLDEEALKSIADITRAQYYRAGSGQDLQAVYKILSKSVVQETKKTEITSYFAAAAALIALLSAGLSVWWFSRVL